MDTEAIFVDGTHIKASANLKRKSKKAVPQQAKRYARELFAEVNQDREEHGKKPFDDDDPKSAPGRKGIYRIHHRSQTAGYFTKGEHKKCFRV